MKDNIPKTIESLKIKRKRKEKELRYRAEKAKTTKSIFSFEK